ncbi:hypothetical protein DFJ73DRAFT_805984 [Zopfochytrium polystomum]|nr:hypothetical protein DFJ73DRAFT_805984 [Zopfochytrium polystomum]
MPPTVAPKKKISPTRATAVPVTVAISAALPASSSHPTSSTSPASPSKLPDGAWSEDLSKERQRRKSQSALKQSLISQGRRHDGGGIGPSPQDQLDPSALADQNAEPSRDAAVARPKLSIWSSPIPTVYFFALYLSRWLSDGVLGVLRNRLLMTSLLVLIGSCATAYVLDGPHQEVLRTFEDLAAWYGWWVMLGIASSIGLGTGLHTFVLFLGPFIARVTLTAYKCNNLDFEVRGVDSFVCQSSSPLDPAPAFLEIYGKVKWAVFFWGLGTSIGELPPYFIARAAAVAGKDDPDFVTVERIMERPSSERVFSERMQVLMYTMMQKMGFFGILICASIPNPLFDLAGIICGHFSIPFFTFWGATFVGKALIKNTIQSMSIVLMFSEGFIESVLSVLRSRLPALHDLIRTALDAQLRQFEKPTADTESPTSIVGLVWNGLLIAMVGYFALSLIEALAQQEQRRRHDLEVAALASDDGDSTLGGESTSGRSSRVSEKSSSSSIASEARSHAGAKTGKAGKRRRRKQ